MILRDVQLPQERGSLTCTPGTDYYPVPPFSLNMIGLKLKLLATKFIGCFYFCATFVLENIFRSREKNNAELQKYFNFIFNKKKENFQN